MSKRKHLEQVHRSGPDIEVPEDFEYLWEWFWELNATRTSNGFSPNPISHLELLSWAMLGGISLQWWETRLIRVMDTAYLKAHEKQNGHSTTGVRS